MLIKIPICYKYTILTEVHEKILKHPAVEALHPKSFLSPMNFRLKTKNSTVKCLPKTAYFHMTIIKSTKFILLRRIKKENRGNKELYKFIHTKFYVVNIYKLLTVTITYGNIENCTHFWFSFPLQVYFAYF